MDDWKLEPAKDLGLSPGERLRSVRRESGLISSGFHIAWWTMIRSYVRTWHRLTIIGEEHLPKKPPFILVANHCSHLDALVLSSPFSWRIRDRIFPIAAGDVFFESSAKSVFAAGLLNALPMWRKKCGPQAMRQLRQRLVEEPCAFILFPEGKRSRDGAMVPFKTGIGMMIAETAVPIIPCHLDGCFQALAPGKRLPRRIPITLRVGPAQTFADYPNERESWEKITQSLETAIRLLGEQKQQSH